MNKKILALLIFVVIATMSTVSAFGLNDLTNASSNNTTDTTATVDGINFKVPNGFKEVVNQTVNNMPDDNPYVDYNQSSKTFTNAKGEAIIFSVSASNIKANDSFAKTASGEGNKTTINGVNGYSFSDPGFEGFTYAKDGKLVIISTTNKQLLNEVIVA